MISTYTVLLAIHILCAVIWVGGGVSIHIMGRRALASGDRQRMLQFSEEANWVGTRIYAPVSLILLVVGVLLVNVRDYSHGDVWISVAYTAWLISFAIGVGYYGRAAKKRDALIAAEGIDGPGFLATYKQVMTVNTIELTILLLVVIDMAIKPGS